MYIGIGEKIKTMREARELSQETLADYLGIQIKDLIRYEDGAAYPPLELIPVLADYFEVSTDDLLCMETFDHEDRIRAYTEQYETLIESGSFREAIELIRSALTHFPKNYRLKYLLLYALYLSCDRPAATKHYTGEILSISRDILGNCTDDAIRLEAKRVLCLHFFEDQHDRDKARAIAMSLPGRISCREDMLPVISEGEDKLRFIQENIVSYTALLTHAIEESIPLNPSFTVKDKIAFYELSRSIRKEIFPESDFYSLYGAMMETDRQLAMLYMDVGEPEKALDVLDEAARFAVAGDAVAKAPYSSPLLRPLHFQKDVSSRSAGDYPVQPLCRIFRDEILTQRCFEPLTYHEKMRTICELIAGK